LENRSGNRPSHEGAAARLDEAVRLCREAGFRRVLLRGDTDFSQTKYLDGWDTDNIAFIFGMDASSALVKIANGLKASHWSRLRRPEKYEVATEPRTRPENVKEEIVREREFTNLRLESEHVAEFQYSPVACSKEYRIVVVRKNISVERGEWVLFDKIRYHFYITNETTPSAHEIVLRANKRCNQENLIAQLKSGVRALHAPVDNLESNWAYMIMASLAWTLKAWFALALPENGRWAVKHATEKRAVLRMEFRTFVNEFMRIPVEIVRHARRTLYRVIGWRRWIDVFFRAVDRIPLLH
jgi:hypothetical protein